MSLNVCIPDLIEQGKMKGARAEEAQQRYDELVLQYRGRFGEAEAQSMATREVLDILDRDLLNRKRQTLLQAQAQARINDQARRTYSGGSADGAPVNGAAMMAHLVRDENARGIANVEYRWRNIKQQALGRLYDLLSAHRPNLLGQVWHANKWLHNGHDRRPFLTEWRGDARLAPSRCFCGLSLDQR